VIQQGTTGLGGLLRTGAGQTTARNEPLQSASLDRLSFTPSRGCLSTENLMDLPRGLAQSGGTRNPPYLYTKYIHMGI